MFPAGSLNHAIVGPFPRIIPLSSVLMWGRSQISKHYSDCFLSIIVRRVAWRRFSKRKANGNYGCHIAGFLLGLSQSGKPRTSVVGLYQIQTVVDCAGRLHSLVASTRKTAGRLEIDGLRSLQLLRPG